MAEIDHVLVCAFLGGIDIADSWDWGSYFMEATVLYNNQRRLKEVRPDESTGNHEPKCGVH